MVCNGVVVLDFQFSDERYATLNPLWRTWCNQKITYAAFAIDNAPYGDTGSEYFRTTPISGWVERRYFDVTSNADFDIVKITTNSIFVKPILQNITSLI